MLRVLDFEEYARNNLDKRTWTYYSQGTERKETLKENLRSFTRYRLVPRMLRNIPVRDMSVSVLGEKLPLPFGIAPTAYQKLAHPEGEIAAAAAAAEMGVIYTLSTAATTYLEDISQSVGNTSPLWMQVYLLKKREYTEEMIRKAEASGYKALVLTVDSPVTGSQHRQWRYPLKLPPHIKPENLCQFTKNLGTEVCNHPYVQRFCSTLTWEDIPWILSSSKLPVVFKGILTVEDAVQAANMGASAVWISNHGGRQLDGVDTALDVLPSISSALDGTGCEVYVDGGIRWGTDILKALALGAKTVFIGRPVLWGLAHSGKNGVKNVLGILKSELDRAMHLTGCKDIQDIGPHLVRKDIHCRL